MTSLACSVSVVLALFLASSPAFAAPSVEPNEPIRITYAASGPSCPTREELVGYVRRYTTRWRVAGDETPSRSFDVVLEPSERQTTVGRLALVAPDSQPREIVGPDCEGVARALALALAVMIDPDADLSGNAREPALEEPPPSPEPAPSPGRTPAPAPPRSHADERPRPPPRNAPPRMAVEGSVMGTTAVVGGLMPVIGLALELEAALPRMPSWVHPSVGVGVRQSLPRDLERNGFATEFLWSAGVLRLCPVRFTGFGGRLELIPCFEADAGILRAAARGTPDAQTSTKPWLDLGGSARATFRIGRTWFAGVAFAVVAPYTRYRFELANEASVSQAPPTGVTFGACGGMRF